MDCDVVEINCKCFYNLYNLLYYRLSNFDEYKWTRHDGGLIVEFKIGDENIRINFTIGFKENIHVGLITWFMGRSKKFSDMCRESTPLFSSRHPTVPIIIVCSNAERKYRSGEMKEAELEGDKLMDREIGDKLARELGAVKYIEYSEETGRGAKILIDEIAFAGIGKIKDDEKRRNKRKRCIKTSIIALCLVFRNISYVSEFNCINLLSLSQYYDINC